MCPDLLICWGKGVSLWIFIARTSAASQIYATHRVARMPLKPQTTSALFRAGPFQEHPGCVYCEIFYEQGNYSVWFAWTVPVHSSGSVSNPIHSQKCLCGTIALENCKYLRKLKKHVRLPQKFHA